MKKSLILPILSLLILSSCADTEGLSKESSRTAKGNLNSVILVEEFADLQCPACKLAHEQIVMPLMQKYEETIRYEFKPFPLRSIHRYALDAFSAAECAADQNPDNFWLFTDQAFKEQNNMTKDTIRKWGRDIVADDALFDRCFTSGIKENVIMKSYREGVDRGVTGTPTFFVNGVEIETGLDSLSKAIEEALASKAQKL